MTLESGDLNAHVLIGEGSVSRKFDNMSLETQQTSAAQRDLKAA